MTREELAGVVHGAVLDRRVIELSRHKIGSARLAAYKHRTAQMYGVVDHGVLASLSTEYNRGRSWRQQSLNIIIPTAQAAAAAGRAS